MDALSKIKQVSKNDLHRWLESDHRDFNVLNVSFKQISSTGRTSVILSKNSAKSFYLKDKSKPSLKSIQEPTNKLPSDCRKDAQNCQYFALFSSKEKRLHTLFKDKIEANFEGSAETRPLLFLTLTFNTTRDDYCAFTTNWSQTDPCWTSLTKKKPWLRKFATNFDRQAEPLKVKIQKVAPEIASNFNRASQLLSQFLRKVRHTFKPSQWKWAVIAELQKNGHWHFHIFHSIRSFITNIALRK